MGTDFQFFKQSNSLWIINYYANISLSSAVFLSWSPGNNLLLQRQQQVAVMYPVVANYHTSFPLSAQQGVKISRMPFCHQDFILKRLPSGNWRWGQLDASCQNICPPFPSDDRTTDSAKACVYLQALFHQRGCFL
ncbi:hypothetical protein GOODEAATRI_027348 [Goodea atripinnis]|uniref:Uncharacterized protein n=1 Tax=Goodea atripinnis TaxID=208336 RepID=A0ABV0NF04_9TELE